VSGGEQEQSQRLQAIMTALLRRRISESLEEAWTALSQWRDENLGVFETHAALLKHAARAERLAERMARGGKGGAASLLREAFDEELVGRDEFVELAGCEPDEVEPLPPVDVEGERTSPPDKRELVEKLLTDGPILVHIDARRDDVSVPGGFRRDPKLVLRFGYGLTPSIVDLSIDGEGIAGTLTFGGIPHRCVLPWPAVYAVVSEVDQRGMVWPDDVPAAVVDQLADETGEAEPPAREAAEPSRRSHLKLVK
jgi:stringent starvation protein B